MKPDVQSGGAGREASPFKFFDHFGVEDRERFGGRDEEIGAVLAGIARGPLFVLYGRSGLGKTSLLLAGVFPRLEARGFAPRRIRLAEAPVEELRRELARPGEEAAAGAAEGSPAERQVVLVLDQFEELFTRFRERPEIWREAGTLLADALAAGAVARVVLAVREDHLAELRELGPSLGDVLANSFRLEPLTAFGTRQAIVRPLDVAGVGYDEGFVNRVVEELAECAYDPVILQIAASEVYRLAAARPERPVRLTAADWQALGGSRGVFVRYLARVGVELGEAGGLARGILAGMITAEGTRRMARLADLQLDLRRTTPAEIEAALGVLDVRFQLVRRPEGKDWYELRHDRLVPAVRAWLQADPAFAELQFARALVLQTTASGAWRTSLDGLVPKAQLQRFVVPNADRIQLDDDAAEMLLRSAILADDASVVEWARALEARSPGRPSAVLQELLADSSGPMKAHAARAATRLPHLTSQALARCLALAQHDPAREVRRAAARAWVRHDGWASTPLDETLRTRAGRRRAREILAALAEVSPFPAPLARWRAAAERERLEEVWAENRDVVYRRVYASALTAPAALVWTLLAALAWLLIKPLIPPHGTSFGDDALVLGGLGYLAFIVAPLVATGSTFERSRSWVLTKANLRFRGRPMSLLLFLVPRLMLLALCVLVAPNMAPSPEGGSGFPFDLLLIALVLLALTPLVARWSLACLGPQPHGRLKALLSAIGWCALCAFPAPLLAVILARSIPQATGPNWLGRLVVISLAGAALVSYGAFMTSMAKAWADHEAPLPGEVPAKASRSARVAALGTLAILVLVLLVRLMFPRTSPVPERPPVAGSGVLEHGLPGHPPVDGAAVGSSQRP